MTNLVTLKVGHRVHILVSWNAVRHNENVDKLLRDELGIQNAPTVFLPVNRG